MNVNFNHIFKDKSIRYSLFLAGALCMLQVIFISVFYFKLPPVIPLFNSLPWGESRLSPVQTFFMVPALLLIFVIINAFLAGNTHRRYALVSRMLALNILLAAVLSTIAIVQIFLLIS